MPSKLFKPVSIVPLVVFRICFGFLIFLESWGAILTGMVKEHYIDPTFTFPFMDFQWLQPLPGNGMYWYFIVMGIFALMVMFGAFYRIATIAYFLMWSGVYFMQKSYYNNHYYLLVLLCFVLIFVPANRKLSVDARINGKIKSDTCPQWCLWIFLVQTSIVYFYAGVAKIYPDWLNGNAIHTLFRYKTHYFLIGPVLGQKWFQLFISYAGIFFDLLIVPALLWRKTRLLAFSISIFFHLFNEAIFQIGIFPFMSILLEIFYFKPEDIKKLFSKWIKPYSEQINNHISNQHQTIIKYAFVLWVIVQIALPLRHWFYKGDVVWSEEGHRLAWRMMLRSKSGLITFTIKDKKNDKVWIIDPQDFVTRSQRNTISTKPDVCWQFVQFLKAHYKNTQGLTELEIYANSSISLNGRKPEPLYNSNIDLAQVKWKRFSHATWLNPNPQIE